MSKNYENMSNEEIKEQLEWSDHHEFSYNYAIWAFEEIDRLNNIINQIDNFVDRTIEIIKQQPTGDDEWILERLNGIKYLIELKEE